MRLIGLFLVLSLFIMPLVGAISTDMRESYQPRETIVIEITGNILKPISAGDVEFKRGNVLVPLNYDLKILGDRYFLWAVAPLEAEEYRLIINDVFTTVEGKQEEVDFEKSFIVDGNRSDYSVTPGFILASDEGFELEVFSYMNEDISVGVSFPEEHDVILKPGKNKFEFNLDTIYGTQFVDIGFGSYTLPALISGTAKTPYHAQNSFLVFEPTIVYADLDRGDAFERKLILRNSHTEEIKKISLDYDEDLFLIEGDKFTLGPGERKEIILKLVGNFDGNINEVIYARSGDVEVAMPVGLALKAERDSDNERDESVLFYCEELEGKTCHIGLNCIGEIKDVKNEKYNETQFCCVGTCKLSEKDEDNSGIFGWLVVILIIIIIVFVVMKYRKTKGKFGSSKARKILEASKDEKKGARFPAHKGNRTTP
jgi:hypothetical protein